MTLRGVFLDVRPFLSRLIIGMITVLRWSGKKLSLSDQYFAVDSKIAYTYGFYELSGLEDELKGLNEKLELMLKRLDYLEALMTQNQEYPELSHVMSSLRVGTSLYSEPLKLIQRLVSVQRRLKRSEEPRDEISRIILNVLAIKGPQNVSSLTREVQLERGTGSRVTVRKKLLELIDEGLIEKGEGPDYNLVE